MGCPLNTDLRSAVEQARSIIEAARPTLDQRATVLTLLEELERASKSIQGGGSQPSALDREREGRIAAEASARRLEFVYETTSAIFASPLDATGRLSKLASFVVPDLADWCICDLVDERLVQRIAVKNWSGSHEALARSLEHEYARAGDALGAIGRVLDDGKPLVMTDRIPGDGGALDPLFDVIGAKSWMVVPLSTAAGVLGALTFVFAESHRKYDASYVALAADLARRAALAVDNAVLVEKLEKAVRARDDMVGVVSHDLRNPLASIKLAATLLADEAKAQNREERKIGMILRATERLETLLRDLLDVTQLEAGGVALDGQRRPVSAVVADAVELIQPLAAAAAIAVETAGDALESSIECDANRLLQVFSNLLGNAVKFTPDEGAVTVAVTISQHDDGSGAGGQCVLCGVVEIDFNTVSTCPFCDPSWTLDRMVLDDAQPHACGFAFM